MRAPSHPPQQLPLQGVLPPMEVRERAPCLREVRVRARHGADVADAEAPPTTRRTREAQDRRLSGDPSHPQNRQRLICCPGNLETPRNSRKALVFVATNSGYYLNCLQCELNITKVSSLFVYFCFPNFYCINGFNKSSIDRNVIC